MASVDPTLREPTATGAVADRADCYRIALRLVREVDGDPDPADVLDLANFLAGNELR
ncbi:hypothetical protein RKD49_005409 [Streptomyces glaucescens]|jgi:hypothetical protein